MCSHLLYGGSHCKIKQDGLQREAQAKTFRFSQALGGFLFYLRVHLHVGHGMFITADWEKVCAFSISIGRLLIKGLIVSWMDGFVCYFTSQEFHGCFERCGGIFTHLWE